MTINAQPPFQNAIEITLSQRSKSYTDDQRANDYYREIVSKQDDYILVHEADSSYRVGEISIPFYLQHTEAEFFGGRANEFSKWLAVKVVDMLSENEKHSFHLTVDFLVSSTGHVTDVKVDNNHSDKELTELYEKIVGYIKESPKWRPERHFSKCYCTPLSIEIKAKSFEKGKGMIVLDESLNYMFQDICEDLWSDSPDKVWSEPIPKYQIASDEIIDKKAHLADDTIDMNQWIKANVQDVTEMIDFEDGSTTVELLISANGWVAEATVIKSDDWLLGRELATRLKCNSPRWTPAKVGEINVPSRVSIRYNWHF